jgi:PKD domain
MYLLSRLLIVALAVIAVLIAVLPGVIGQQPGTVSIRRGVTSSQPGVPEVHAKADRNRVPLGDEVTFTLAPASVVTDSRVTVTIYFGDGAKAEVHQTEIVHLYRAVGTYTYAILVKAKASPPAPKPSEPQIPNVKLIASPNPVPAKNPVTFTAQLSHSYPNLQYRFAFADGSQTDWQKGTQTSHEYAGPQTYLAYVDIGEGGTGAVKRIGGSPRQPIQVTPSRSVVTLPSPSPTPRRSPARPTPTPEPRGSASPSPSNATPSPTPISSVSPNASPSATATASFSPTPDQSLSPDGGLTNSNSASPETRPTSTVSRTTNLEDPSGLWDDWWKYLLLLLLLILAYQAAKIFLSPHPEFVPNIDPGDSHVAAGKPVSIDYQVALDPNVAGGQSRIETGADGLIKSERGSDG